MGVQRIEHSLVSQGYTKTHYKKLLKVKERGGGVKMAEEQDQVITFSSTNSLKEQQNSEHSLQNNF